MTVAVRPRTIAGPPVGAVVPVPVAVRPIDPGPAAPDPRIVPARAVDHVGLIGVAVGRRRRADEPGPARAAHIAGREGRAGAGAGADRRACAGADDAADRRA